MANHHSYRQAADKRILEGDPCQRRDKRCAHRQNEAEPTNSITANKGNHAGLQSAGSKECHQKKSPLRQKGAKGKIAKNKRDKGWNRKHGHRTTIVQNPDLDDLNHGNRTRGDDFLFIRWAAFKTEVPMKRLALFSILALSHAVPAAADMLPGYDRFDLMADHRARPIAASIWYPAANPTYRAPVGDGPIFDPTFAFIGPAVAEGEHPLVLLSHGSGGNSDSLGWLTSGLVAEGAIVLAVNHPGSTSGDSSPRRSTDLDARANDLSAALDMVLSDPAFSPFIDESRVGVVGFSLGGTTALGLGGVRFNGEVQDENCATGPEAADCVFFRLGDVRFADYPGYHADARDPRIIRAVIVDPGFGGSADPESLQDALAGMTLINLGDADRLGAVDVGPDGNNLAEHLPDATYVEIAPANHFTFLGTCKPHAADLIQEDGDDPICTDPEDTDRAAVHGQLVDVIAEGLGL